MKTIKSPLLVLIISAMTLMLSCKKSYIVNVEDLEITIPENPSKGQRLGIIEAYSKKGYLTFTLLSESVKGALKVDQNTGVISVKDKAKFNYEVNTVITAEVLVGNDREEAMSNIRITIEDVYEQPGVIGEYRDFGIVFWLDPNDNSRGMICSTYDQTSDANWSCSNADVVDAMGTAIGTGYQNTMAILEGCADSFTGAYKCNHYSDGGFTDWYLPSRDELMELYNHKDIISATSISKGGLPLSNSYYWSSSQASLENAYAIYFNDGTVVAKTKAFTENVRAVRKFGTW